MVSPSARLVASRFQDRTGTLIYRDGDLWWGWFTRDVPARMHLTLISPSAYTGIVWLEDHGRRILSSTGFPRGIVRPLFAWVNANREAVEARWLRFMTMKSWLSVRVTDDELVLVCYAGEPTEFTRPIDTPVWIDRY